VASGTGSSSSRSRKRMNDRRSRIRLGDLGTSVLWGGKRFGFYGCCMTVKCNHIISQFPTALTNDTDKPVRFFICAAGIAIILLPRPAFAGGKRAALARKNKGEPL
jgi:hypothetical protein